MYAKVQHWVAKRGIRAQQRFLAGKATFLYALIITDAKA